MPLCPLRFAYTALCDFGISMLYLTLPLQSRNSTFLRRTQLSCALALQDDILQEDTLPKLDKAPLRSASPLRREIKLRYAVTKQH